MVCRHCSQPIYYSWGYKVYAHEGHRPSKLAALRRAWWTYAANAALPGTWAKWIECESPSGDKIGTEAEPK